MTVGARLMLSTPPATNRSPSPQVMACAAVETALSPLAQLRWITMPGTSIGSPERRPAWRATQRLSSPAWLPQPTTMRSEEHTSELQSLMRISYAVFCLKKKTTTHNTTQQHNHDTQHK